MNEGLNFTPKRKRTANCIVLCILIKLLLKLLEGSSSKLYDTKNVQFNIPDLSNRGLQKFNGKVIVRGLSGGTGLWMIN